MVAWGKTFASFVAVPLGILLVMMAILGYSSLDDLKHASDRLAAAVDQAQTDVLKASAKAKATAEAASIGAITTANEVNFTTDRTKKRLKDAEADISTVTAKAEQAKLKFDALNAEAEKILAQERGLKGEIDQLKQTDQRSQSEISSLKTKVQQLIGDLAAQKESNNAPPGAIFGNPDEKLYGPWGIGVRYLRALLEDPHFPFKEKFKGLQPGSAPFDAVWASVGQSDPRKFREAQQRFIYDSLYSPFVKKVKKEDEVDIKQRSQTLQEVVLRVANHAGYDLPLKAIQDMKTAGKWNAVDPRFDEFFIRALYRQLIAQSKPKNLAAYQNELTDELAKLAAESKSVP